MTSDNLTDSLVEVVAKALHFDHVDLHGYPNGLMTWDEMPGHIEHRVTLDAKDHWRSLATAALAAARPIILEEAAVQAMRSLSDKRMSAAGVATAIRSLGEKKDD